MTDASPADAPLLRHLEYLRADPDNAHLLLTIGDLYHQGGRFDEAETYYRRCLTAHPAHAAAHSRMAAVMLSRHRFQEAGAIYERLLGDAPGDAALHHNHGIALFHERRFAEAREAFETAARCGLDSADNWAYRTRCAHFTGDMAAALELGSQWSHRAPGAAVDGYLALVMMDCGEFDAAHARAEAVLRSDPDNPDAALVAAYWCAEHQETARAEALFQSVAGSQPQNPRAWLGMGLMHLQARRWDDAIVALRRALALEPGHVGTAVTLGWAFIPPGRHGEAEQAFRAAIEIDRTFAEAHGGLAVALTLQNRRAEAHAAVERARRIDAGSFGWVYAQSTLLALEGDRDKGERLMSMALKKSPRGGGPSLIDAIRMALAQPPAVAPPTAAASPLTDRSAG